MTKLFLLKTNRKRKKSLEPNKPIYLNLYAYLLILLLIVSTKKKIPYLLLLGWILYTGLDFGKAKSSQKFIPFLFLEFLIPVHYVLLIFI